jgi:Uncharacterised protein family (UPF0182)
VAGFHGPVDQTALDIRRPGAPFVAAVAVATALASLVWGWRDHPALILGSWAGLLLSVAGCYLVVPGIVRASGVTDGPTLVRQRATFERLAFGLSALEPGTGPPPGFSSLAQAAQDVPLWDAKRVAQVTGTQPGGVRLWSQRGGGPPAWLVVPLAPPGAPRVAVEADTGLVIGPVGTAAADSSLWFGPGFSESALASPAAWPGLREAGAGIPLVGAWRRLALAWALQGLDVTRAETDSLVLLWRRDVAGRLGRVAPFATFGEPVPALSDGAVWWVSWGYVTTDAFPLARPLESRHQRIGSLRAGLIGAVRGATGETRLWLAPGYDSLTAAWARHFEPLIEPTDQIPAALRAQLEYPTELFRLAAAHLVRASGDSAVWTLRPKDPARISAPDPWTLVGIEAGAARRFVGVLAGTMSPTGPRLLFWRPEAGAPAQLPSELFGSRELRPGDLRIWPASGAVFTAQAQFLQPVDEATPPRLGTIYLSLGDRTGEGATRALALRNLTTGTRDTTLTARWELARRLMVRADSALAAGNLELFGQIWKDLMRLLAPARQPR